VPLNIKSEEAHELARELSDITDTTITEAVTRALRETLARERRQRRSDQNRRAQDLMQIAGDCAGLPVVDDRSPDQILAYDRHGTFS